MVNHRQAEAAVMTQEVLTHKCRIARVICPEQPSEVVRVPVTLAEA